MRTERRLYPRAVVRRPARVRATDDADWVEGLLFDVSAGGAGVHLDTKLTRRTDVRLAFSLPVAGAADLTVEANCLVVRSAPTLPPDAALPLLYGLHFLDLDEPTFEGLRGWVWSRIHPEVG